MQKHLIVFVTLLLASNASAQVVVEDTNISFTGSGTSYSGTIVQDLGGDYTSVFFGYENGNLNAVAWNIDEESDWYLVQPGDRFSSASIANGDHETIFTTDNPRGPIFVGETTFYLGVNTGVGIDLNGTMGLSRDVFGWVQLRYNQGVLEQVGSAVAYGGNGIIAGTNTAIPEPRSLMLLQIGACASCFRRRRLT